MISFEKFKIKFSYYTKTFVYHLVFWGLAFSFYSYLTNDYTLFVNYQNILWFDNAFANAWLFAVTIAVLFTVVESFLAIRWLRWLPVRLLVALRSVINFSVAFLILLIAANPKVNLMTIRTLDDFLALVPAFDQRLVKFAIYFAFAISLNALYKGIFLKIGQGNFLRWFSGALDRPREETRIFMFLDMKDSTAQAEKLGHQSFSKLVQDVFNDLSVVTNYGGEIYQYVGDGAIISWSVKRGIQNQNCIRAFFAFQKVVNRRKRYYTRRYNKVPQFKAGIHMGQMMVLQVGRIRREISYNGDTLNTAARIESLCNEYKQNLLISGVLYERLDRLKGFLCKEVGTIKLKGKRKAVQIYQVRQRTK